MTHLTTMNLNMRSKTMTKRIKIRKSIKEIESLINSKTGKLDLIPNDEDILNLLNFSKAVLEVLDDKN